MAGFCRQALVMYVDLSRRHRLPFWTMIINSEPTLSTSGGVQGSVMSVWRHLCPGLKLVKAIRLSVMTELQVGLNNIKSAFGPYSSSEHRRLDLQSPPTSKSTLQLST